MKEIKWDISRADSALIDSIVDRAMTLRKAHGMANTKDDRLTIRMDLVACHRNGNALDLHRLLAFDDANFGHDVFGISKYMDRHTGQLTECFLPRCSAVKTNVVGRTSRRDKSMQQFVDQSGGLEAVRRNRG